MKNKLYLLSFVFLGLLLLSSCIIYVPYPEGSPPPQEEPYYEEDYRDTPSRYDTSYFYDHLSPHGMWVNHSPYGYVWIPRVYKYGWRPYSNGNWIWTDFGWTWVSDWEWGWIPFHYGRWDWDNYLGWYWVPDTVWGPAWVTWRRSSLYIGWSPIPPGTRFVPGVGIRTVTIGLSGRHWIFIEYPYFYRTHIYRYMLPVERNQTIISYTIHKTNIVQRDRRIVNEGIDREYIQNRVEKPIIKHVLKDASRPMKSVVRLDEFQVFRPNIEKNETAKPKTVLKRENIRNTLVKTRIQRTGRISQKTVEPTLKENQVREVTILKKSQEKEISMVRKESEASKKNVANAADKAKIEKETRVKINTLLKKHKTEETKQKERHKEEEAKVRKVIKKKKKSA